MKPIMKKITATLIASSIVFMFVSCASKDSAEDYDYSYDYREDEYEFINDEVPESTEDFLADIGPVDLAPIYFLKKSGKKVSPREVTKVALIPRTNAVEFHFRDGTNEVAVIWRKAERDKILNACMKFLQQYEDKTLPHSKVNKKNAYFASTCSLWFGLISTSNGCVRNNYYVIPEFIDKKPYLLIRFAPTQTTSGQDTYTPKISLYMSPQQIRDFLEQMDQTKLEEAIKENKKKAYTY